MSILKGDFFILVLTIEILKYIQKVIVCNHCLSRYKNPINWGTVYTLLYRITCIHIDS